MRMAGVEMEYPRPPGHKGSKPGRGGEIKISPGGEGNDLNPGICRSSRQFAFAGGGQQRIQSPGLESLQKVQDLLFPTSPLPCGCDVNGVATQRVRPSR